MLTKEDKEFIINLSNEMQTQDNMSTAQPFALVLREEEREYTPDGYGDDEVMIYDGEEFNTPNELAEYFDLPNELSYDSFDGVLDIIESSDTSFNRDDFELISCRTSTVIKESHANFFITHKAYDDHIRVNGHNLNKPSKYGIHLYRNEEMNKLYQVIHNLANELKGL